MKTTPVTPADLQSSVLAVPPLARHADLSLNVEGNRAMVRHLEDGGVRTLMYGGNANFYNIGVREYPAVLDLLEQIAGADSWVIPSIGPEYGKACDQIDILRERAFPTAMLLPLLFPSTNNGLATGFRKLAERYGKPLILYIKSDGYLTVDTVAALMNDGLVSAVKYGTVRENPAQDPFLRELLQKVDASRVISGIGENPAIIHLRDFGLQAFTSGSVCVAPRGSMKLLQLLKDKNYAEAEKVRAAYMPLEAARDGISPIRVLHEAVTLAGIADMGPMLPMLSNIDPADHARVGEAARALLAHDRALA
ncbi:dihydrodipicolinate synthase family protein [Xylophilus sp. GW821-FHT01B05]